jgi:hypothetical protein
MNPKRLHQITRSLLAALVLSVLAVSLAPTHASETTTATKAATETASVRRWARAQDPVGNQNPLPPEKRQKLHRLDPTDVFKSGNDRAERTSSKDHELSRRERRERRKRKQREREAPLETAAETTPTPAETRSLPPAAGALNAPTPTGTPGLSASAAPTAEPRPTLLTQGQPTAPVAAVAAVAPRGEQPGWLLPLVALMFLVVLGALLMVLGKLNKILRGSGI